MLVTFLVLLWSLTTFGVDPALLTAIRPSVPTVSFDETACKQFARDCERRQHAPSRGPLKRWEPVDLQLGVIPSAQPAILNKSIAHTIEIQATQRVFQWGLVSAVDLPQANWRMATQGWAQGLELQQSLSQFWMGLVNRMETELVIRQLQQMSDLAGNPHLQFDLELRLDGQNNRAESWFGELANLFPQAANALKRNATYQRAESWKRLEGAWNAYAQSLRIEQVSQSAQTFLFGDGQRSIKPQPWARLASFTRPVQTKPAKASMVTVAMRDLIESTVAETLEMLAQFQSSQPKNPKLGQRCWVVD